MSRFIILLAVVCLVGTSCAQEKEPINPENRAPLTSGAPDGNTGNRGSSNDGNNLITGVSSLGYEQEDHEYTKDSTEFLYAEYYIL
jgi:hypothetical protein